MRLTPLLYQATWQQEERENTVQVTQRVRGSTGLGHRSQESREPTTGRLGGGAWSAPPEQAACWVQEARVLRVGEGSPLGISPGEVGTVNRAVLSLQALEEDPSCRFQLLGVSGVLWLVATCLQSLPPFCLHLSDG